MSGRAQTAMDMGRAGPAQPGETYDSVAWKVNGERVVLLGWGAAMLMEFAHPLVAAGVAEHSVAVAQPRARLRRSRHTIKAMLALTFGMPDQAAGAARRINAIHDRVHGRLRQSVGPFPAGTLYSAHDPALLLWVHATLLYAFPRAYELYVGPLTREEKDRWCAEGAGMTAVLGVPDQDMPRSSAELEAYLDSMLAGGTITVGETARELAAELLAPSYPPFVRPLAPLLRLPTVGLLPPALRRAYGLRWDARHEAALHLSAWLVRRLLPLVPAMWRHWPEARAAMKGREPERVHTPHRPKLSADCLQEVPRGY